MRNLYLDDIRDLPKTYTDSWLLVRSPFDALKLLKLEKFNIVSLDHDLGCFVEGNEITGLHVLRKMIELYQDRPELKCNKVIVHSANIVGTKNMMNLVKYFWE